jgi:uncharacterized protein (DUF1684 family)
MKATPAVSALIVATAMLIAIAGCDRGSQQRTDQAEAAAKAAAEKAFATEQRQWREERAAGLTRADGWTSLVGLHWITPGPHFVGSSPGSGIRLAVGPPELGLLTLEKDGRLRLVPARRARLTLDDAPLDAPATLASDGAEAGPSRIGFDEGKGVATVIKRGERYALRVSHAEAPTRTGFAGLDYWPASRDWVVQARFVAHPPGRTIPIANIIGTIDETPNPGAVEFTHQGRLYRLEALDGGDGSLFLVFADRTNGRGSYGAGRFLDAPAPDAQGRVGLDFNRSYNPPCAFTAFATCPLPPPENRLDLAIDAGEKAYAGQH